MTVTGSRRSRRLAAFRGHRYDDLADHGTRFARTVHDGLASRRHDRRAARPPGRRGIAWSSCRLRSRCISVRSATCSASTRCWRTRLEIADGVATGALDRPNCRGPEKVRRLHAWIDDRFGGRTNVRVVAYGDSAGDRELLADADEAHWMTPDGRAA